MGDGLKRARAAARAARAPLGGDPEDFRAEQQEVIGEAVKFIDAATDGTRLESLLHAAGIRPELCDDPYSLRDRLAAAGDGGQPGRFAAYKAAQKLLQAARADRKGQAQR
jgi:hypothetical protein